MSELKDLIEKKFKIKKINNVKPEYRRKIFKACLKTSELSKDIKFVRMWEMYLSGCSAAFRYRDLVVFQYQLVKNFDAIPSNRRDYIYS